MIILGKYRISVCVKMLKVVIFVRDLCQVKIAEFKHSIHFDKFESNTDISKK